MGLCVQCVAGGTGRGDHPLPSIERAFLVGVAAGAGGEYQLRHRHGRLQAPDGSAPAAATYGVFLVLPRSVGGRGGRLVSVG
ncbi:hypothetical protein D3C79_821690 [compost metagenome]